MKFILLLISSFCFLQLLQAQVDTAFYQNILQKKIKLISVNNKMECWVICNNESNNIYRIDSNLNVFDKTQEFKKITKSVFTDILTINKNAVLLTTLGDCAYIYKDGKILHLNKYFGLTDDSLISASFSVKSNRIFIESTTNGFASIDSSFLNYLKFTNCNKTDSSQAAFTDDDNNLEFVFSSPFTPINNYFSELTLEPDNKPKSHIKLSQLNAIKKQLEPCDILLKRDNWNFTNNIISGFWTHTGIYIGNIRQLNQYFSGIEMLKGMKPAAYIRKHYPKIYFNLIRKRNPVIEAVTKGVKISKFKNIAKVDYFAALRPDLSKEDKFLSLLKSFDYFKLPYDFDLDFSNADAVLCSELVYLSFIPSPIKNGIHLELGTLFGNPFLYPSDIVKKFDQEFGSSKSELQYVLFYDCITSEKKAFKSSVEEFRKTWKRSRFDFLQK